MKGFAILAMLVTQASFLFPQFANANALHAAILPNEVGHLSFNVEQPKQQEFFATIINDTDILAENCSIELQNNRLFTLRFWATEPTQNRVIGLKDAPADIPPRGSQSFRFTLELLSDVYLLEQRIGFSFACDTHSSAAQISGLNDVLLSAGTPKVLLALATPSEDNRVILDTQLGDQKCFGTQRFQEDPAPCAVGVMALAMLNNSEERTDLLVQVDTDGPAALLCRTNSLGVCQQTSESFGTLDFQLDPNEIATFSAFLLSFQDEYFGFVRRPRMVGFSVFGFHPESGTRQRLAARVATGLISPAFQWSAISTNNQITVRGAVAVSNSCGRGILRLSTTAQPPPGELHLELVQADVPPTQICLQAIGLDLVSWSSDGPVGDIENIVVSYTTTTSFLERPPLRLPVQRLPDSNP